MSSYKIMLRVQIRGAAMSPSSLVQCWQFLECSIFPVLSDFLSSSDDHTVFSQVKSTGFTVEILNSVDYHQHMWTYSVLCCRVKLFSELPSSCNSSVVVLLKDPPSTSVLHITWVTLLCCNVWDLLQTPVVVFKVSQVDLASALWPPHTISPAAACSDLCTVMFFILHPVLAPHTSLEDSLLPSLSYPPVINITKQDLLTGLKTFFIPSLSLENLMRWPRESGGRKVKHRRMRRSGIMIMLLISAESELRVERRCSVQNQVCIGKHELNIIICEFFSKCLFNILEIYQLTWSHVQYNIQDSR